MNLYTTESSIRSHRTRVVLNEKDIVHECIFVDPKKIPEDLIDLNPYGTLPTLVDRDLVLYDSRIIIEYLEERFPHPPLMPVGPVQRAKIRLALYQVEQDWYPLVDIIETKGEKSVEKAKKELTQSIVSIAEVFSVMPYFFSEDFTLVDASVAPILWRLRHYGIELPSEAKAVNYYADRLFERNGFKLSLSEAELEMRLP